VWFSSYATRQTDRHTEKTITILRIPYGDEVIMYTVSQKTTLTERHKQ